MSIKYLDFSIKIEPRRGEAYPVIVLQSPAGEGRSEFRLPFRPEEIGTILHDLGQTVRGSSHAPEAGMAEVSYIEPDDIAPDDIAPDDIGDGLFTALFSGPTSTLFHRSMGMIHGKERGLRIKIHIDPEDPSLATLASLPWELLYLKATRDYLNLSRTTPIIRYLDVQRPHTPLALDGNLRILVVISDPVDHPGLDLDRERRLIEKTWAQQEDVEVEFIETATIANLQDRLERKDYHVLHYMGHGDFDEHTGRGVLIMEDKDQRGVPVDGSTLAVLLRDTPSMRLVFLNACDTSRVSRKRGQDPCAGVASALVLAGIPAVVAMQFPITDAAAIRFSRRFYPLLARGQPVDYAVAEGRRAIRLADSTTMEWATPVLFMRASDGVIFQTYGPADSDQLALLYGRAREHHVQKKWQAVCDVFSQIHAEDRNYPDPEGLLASAEHEIEARRQRAEQDKQDAERRQRQASRLYQDAVAFFAAGQWHKAQEAIDKVHNLAPHFDDSQQIAARAEKKLAEQTAARQAEEAARQAKADAQRAQAGALYAAAASALAAGFYQEALEKWYRVRQVDPAYPDEKGVEAQARAGLAALAVTTATAAQTLPAEEPERKQGMPLWLVATVAGVVLVTVVAIVLLAAGGKIGGGAEATHTPTAIAQAAPTMESRAGPAIDVEPSLTPTPTTAAPTATTPDDEPPATEETAGTPPRLTVLSPGPSTSVEPRQSLTVDVEATGGQGISAIRLWVDGQLVLEENAGGAQQVRRSLDWVAPAAPGTYLLEMRIVDTAGQISDRTQMLVSVVAPTDSAQPLTATSTPTTTPTPTPTLTPIPPCSIPVAGRFAADWDRNLLGCPTSGLLQTWAGEQLFEGGYMLWRKDADAIYVFNNSGSSQRFTDTWDENIDPACRGAAPPIGLQEPCRGFGKVWYEQLGGPNAAIGWAFEPEAGFDLIVQDFERGIIFYRDGIGNGIAVWDE